ncbi:twin-arginine translocation pathway signal sequence domain protein, putative [Ruegeria pomeroyi DSS-3]|uniref:Twin-arginine translocation pathway signal sequence domain protein, putative n=2 Tax=Ruegeria pomeroyi TaxID=89184 RepID=Q5LUA3_RUEPO|nr:twin-arginine translocation pathway signal sequence domain protein, putative [Ruegeria pomeroyi DSS-3]
MTMLNRRTLLSGLAGALTASALPLWAETPVFYADDGAAIRGYDTVAYFTQGAPVQGAPAIAVMWKGAVWHFASHENRAAFEANPRAFAPQFGGYCAYAVARGYTTDTDPTAWRIVDGELFLIHSPEVARLWAEDIAGNIAGARRNWPSVLDR